MIIALSLAAFAMLRRAQLAPVKARKK